MATTYEATETFNEPMDRLCENLLANLNKKGGPFATRWSAVYTEEYRLESQQQVRQIWGLTSAYSTGADQSAYFIHFLVKFTSLSSTSAIVHIVAVNPYPTFDNVVPGFVTNRDGPFQPYTAGFTSARRLEKIAAKILEFCVIPNADTDVSLMGRFKGLLGRSKDKRKTDDKSGGD